ncbi:branched-chain amino acid ABC transporter permease [Marivivens donghaensis]|uniref:Branched-chain amino acid ABC transporter permease n=1 Tax=Marivivens donghaensis TaxID=1699413 RepID=A0ABX0W243_9RHOB|nr:AzlC family ABC transporter permease [Marivivens donghaensis]NIY73561.1 branched-chain amino acid ABC transporter permease [Marivivens donghaensis]
MTSPIRAAYFEGFRSGIPFFLVIIPFGMLFGVVALDAGMALGQAMAMTMLVIAGASQFAALHMMADNAGVALVVSAALAVNLRMAMYSAALVPHLGAAPLWQRALVSYGNFDQTYAVSIAKYEERPDWTPREKSAFFLGVATPIIPAWGAASLVGALIGSGIPADWGLDFMLPITFISLIGPMLRTLPQVLTALASVIFGLIFSGLPSGTGLLLAGIIAMFVGALSEMAMERRAA